MDYLQINELYHWGIKGMKWGVRNYRNEDGTLTPAGKARYNDDGTRKKAKDMSDDDLEKSNRRLQSERQYAMLSETKRHKNFKAAKRLGASVVGSFLISGGASYAANAIEKGTLDIGKKAVKQTLIIGSLASAGALTVGLVSSQGGQINRVSSDVYFSNKRSKK